VITEIIDSTGDGGDNGLNAPTGVAVDGGRNVYVAGLISNNAFKITPGGVITEIIDSTGDGGGNGLNAPEGIAVDEVENVYVVGSSSDNAFKIAASDGTVKSFQKISDTQGGFTGVLGNDDRFGASVANLGDLNGDGVNDLAVGASLDDDGGTNRGAVWILFMNSDGTVKSHQKISDTQGGFTGVLGNTDFFGISVANIGDLNIDGVNDLAVGAHLDDDGGSNNGAVWILFLNSDGTVKSFQKISDTVGNFGGTLDNGDVFGRSVANLGDLNGDGVNDLAVGAAGDDDGGLQRGAVWILFMKTDGTVVSQQKISDTVGNIGITLDNSDQFGDSVANMGDLNGDGVNDLAVGASFDVVGGGDRGEVWILFLKTDGTVVSQQKISDTAGNFGGTLDDFDRFGVSVANMGDLNGDGVNDLAVGAQQDNVDGFHRGAVWILFMNSDGTVKSHQKISDTQGGFTGGLDNSDFFGTSVANISDLNSEGVNDLAVGAAGDDDGGSARGAVWILFLNKISPLTSTIKITKIATGGDAIFNFTLSNSTLTLPLSINTTATNMTTPITVDPGLYNVTEIVPAGWTLDASNCLINGVPQNTTLNFNVTSGDTVECIFDDTFVIPPDNDGDGIQNEIDAQPNTPSFDFTDIPGGGTTNGTITSLGDQTLSITEEVDPDGVRITVVSSSGPTPATVSVCGGIATLSFGAGDEVVVTCSSVTVKVIGGTVGIEFVATDGTTGTTTLGTGGILTFDPATFTITNSGPIPAIVEVDGETITIGAGETFTLPGDFILTDFLNGNLLRLTPAPSPGPGPNFALSIIASGLGQPRGLAIDPSGDFIVTTAGGNLLRVTPGGSVTPITSGHGDLFGVAIDSSGNFIVTDFSNGNLLKVTPSGSVSTITSDLATPRGITIDSNGDFIIADGTSLLRVDSGGSKSTITTFTGFRLTKDVAIDSNGDFIVLVTQFTATQFFKVSNPSGSQSSGGFGGTSNPSNGIALDSTGAAFAVTEGRLFSTFVKFPIFGFPQNLFNFFGGERPFDVEIEPTTGDAIPPTITCPPDVILEAPADTSPSNTGVALVTDNVNPPPVPTFRDVDNTDALGLGTIERTWTATDASGNSSECVQIITVTTPEIEIGGTLIPIDTTALLIAGFQINAIWMIPAIVLAGAGIAIYKLKRK